MRVNSPTTTEHSPRPDRSNRPKLLVTLEMAHLPQLRKRLEADYDALFARRPSIEALETMLGDRECWLVNPCHVRVDANLLDHAPKLEFIASASTGSDHLDLAELERRDIRAYYLKGTPVIDEVHASAEFSFTLMLNVIKRAVPAFEAARFGVWRDADDAFRGIEAHGKTIGLVGLGRIGKKMATFAKGFGMNVIGCDPYVSMDLPWVKQVDFDTLLEQAEIVCAHVHLNDETRGMFNQQSFAKMPHGSYFINTSRGGVVVEPDLIEALQSGRLAAAGVDVISGEFEEGKYHHPLIKYARSHDNLIVSPHIAGNTVDSTRKTAIAVIEQMDLHFGVAGISSDAGHTS